MSETRYIRLVDGQPTQTGYTGLGNITGSIEVSMKFKPTRSAPEPGTIPVAFVDVAAVRTLLGSVPGIDKDNLLAKVFRLVPDKLFKLVKRPAIQFPVELCAMPFLHPDLGKIFESEYSKGFLDYLLRDAVIHIGNKPPFSSAHPLKFAASRSRAFCLKLCSEPGVLRPPVLHRTGIKESVIGTYRDVHDSPVDPEDMQIAEGVWGSGFDLAMQVKPAIVPVQEKVRGLDFPSGILQIVFGNKERRPDPSGACRKSGKALFEIDPDNSLVVPHCREFFTEWFHMAFVCFQGFAGTVPRTLKKGAGKIRNGMPDIKISRMVAVDLVRRVVGKAPLCAGVERHRVISHGLEDLILGTIRDFKLQLDCPNHSNIFVGLGIKGNGGDADALPPLPECRGLRAALR
jgi:hypothetical protein